nr:uncharacterized mitochondrial protein AtMg00820-like [Nicotiana tomentosiformis]
MEMLGGPREAQFPLIAVLSTLQFMPMPFHASFDVVPSDDPVIVTTDNITSASTDNSSPNSSHTSEPSSFEEAVVSPAWQAAIVQEFEALYANNTWNLVPLPLDKTGWVYKVKHRSDGTIERFKARLVVKGYTQ